MGKNVIWELCGIPNDLWIDMEKNDKEKINGTIKNIKQNLETILQIKLMYLDTKKIRKSLKNIEDDDEKERYISNVFNIGFYSLVSSHKKRFELLYK